jgi:hypothetical protein
MSDIQAGIKAIDQTMQCGDNWFVVDEVSKGTRIPKVLGEPIFFYKVPAGKKYTVQSLVVFGYGNWRSIAGTQVAPRVFKFRLNGADKVEWQALPHYNYTNAGRMLWKNCARGGAMAPMGDGLQFAAGDVITIQLVPATATQWKLCWAWLEGVETVGGARVLALSREKVTSVTTNILTYTVGANGFTLKNFGADAMPIDQNLDAYIRVAIRGQIAVETEFKCANDSCSRPPQFTLPLCGLDLLQGDTIEVYAADLWQAGEKVSVTVFGTLSDLGGGGVNITEIKNEFPKCYGNGLSAELRSRVS